MAVTFGAASTSVTGSFSNPVTVTGFATAGSDRVGIAHYGGQSDGAISGVTWNGVAMTQAVDNTQISTIAGNILAGCWYIVNPPTGASNVVFSFTDDFAGRVCASYFNGVDQSTPVRAGSAQEAEILGGSGALSVACSCSAGDMGVESSVQYGGTGLSSPLGTQIFNAEDATALERWGAGSYRAAAGSTVQLGWTADTDDSAIAGFALQAASGGVVNDEAAADGVAATSAVGSMSVSAVPPPPYTLTRVTG